MEVGQGKSCATRAGLNTGRACTSTEVNRINMLMGRTGAAGVDQGQGPLVSAPGLEAQPARMPMACMISTGRRQFAKAASEVESECLVSR